MARRRPSEGSSYATRPRRARVVQSVAVAIATLATTLAGVFSLVDWLSTELERPRGAALPEPTMTATPTRTPRPRPTATPTRTPRPTPTATPAPESSSGDGVPAWLLLAAGGSIGVSVVASIASGLSMVRARRRSREIDEVIESSVRGGAAQDELKEQVRRKVDPAAREIADKHVETYLLHEAKEAQEVERIVLAHIAVLPREAKRVLNHARLLTLIARRRRIFGGDPELTPAHLGKWIVLSERWLPLANRIKDDPALMERLDGARGAALRTSLEALSVPASSSSELERLLNAPPPLADVIERLLRFDPADDEHVTR
jgi:hypothetical protein